MASTEAEWPSVGDDDLKTISTSTPTSRFPRTPSPRPSAEPLSARERDSDPIPPSPPTSWFGALGFWPTLILFPLTSLAVVSVSAWLLLPYWLLFGWILFGAVGRPQKDIPAPSPAPGLVRPDDDPVDASVPGSMGPELIVPVEEPPPAKAKRPRSRAKGKAKAAAETPCATWVRVGPGKFVRVENPGHTLSPSPLTDGQSHEGEAPPPNPHAPLEQPPGQAMEEDAGLPANPSEPGPGPGTVEDVAPNDPPPASGEDVASVPGGGGLNPCGPVTERWDTCSILAYEVRWDGSVRDDGPIRRAGFPRLATARLSGRSRQWREDFEAKTAEWLRPRREIRSDRPEPRKWLRGFSRRLRRGIATRAPPR